jgi:hypothetical protein
MMTGTTNCRFRRPSRKLHRRVQGSRVGRQTRAGRETRPYEAPTRTPEPARCRESSQPGDRFMDRRTAPYDRMRATAQDQVKSGQLPSALHVANLEPRGVPGAALPDGTGSSVPLCRGCASRRCTGGPIRGGLQAHVAVALLAEQPPGADARLAAAAAEARNTALTPISLAVLLAVAEVVPDDGSSATVGRVMRVVRPESVDGCARSRGWRLPYGCGPRNLMSIRRGSQRRLGARPASSPARP